MPVIIWYHLLMQLICLTDNYLCLISNLVASGFSFQPLAPVQFCSSGLKHLLTPHILILQVFIHYQLCWAADIPDVGVSCFATGSPEMCCSRVG